MSIAARPVPRLVVAALLAFAAGTAGAVNCFVILDRSDYVIYRDVFPPVDLSDAGKADRDAMRARGEVLMWSEVEQCPRIEFLTGPGGPTGLKLDQTLAGLPLPADAQVSRSTAQPAPPRKPAASRAAAPARPN
jgi:hypothetical protein